MNATLCPSSSSAVGQIRFLLILGTYNTSLRRRVFPNFSFKVQFPIPSTKCVELSPMVTSPLIFSYKESSVSLYHVICLENLLSIIHALLEISFDSDEYNT